MHLAFVRGSRVARAGLLIAVLLSASQAWAVQGAGSLYVPSSTSQTPTHWNIPNVGTTVAEIHGVLPSEIGGSCGPTLDVFVKSSTFGNTMVTATQIGSSCDYTFSYTPPSVANGDPLDACATTIVAYFSPGLNSNNDLIDDGMQNGSTDSASGFRFLDADGNPISCT